MLVDRYSGMGLHLNDYNYTPSIIPVKPALAMISSTASDSAGSDTDEEEAS